MVITIVEAMTAISIGVNIIQKGIAAAKAGKVADLSEEIALLESSRLAPADEIIKQADEAMGKG